MADNKEMEDNLKEQQKNAEFLQRAANPQPPFKIAKNQLIDIAAACQERYFAEEIELINDQGGDQWLEQGLCTDFKNGILGTPDDLQKRDFAFQNNEKPAIELKSFIELLCGALEDFTLRILILCALISMIIEILVNLGTEKMKTAWIDGMAIMVAVIVVSMVTAVNDYEKERQFQALNNVADERKVVSVIRNGVNYTIHMSKVMVGDLVILTEGMEIPADGYLVQSAELTTDESAMTGESDPVKKEVLSHCVAKMKEIIFNGEKNEVGKHGVPSNIIMSGTRILTGEGKMIIIVVGDSSCVGKISALLRQSDPESTPLQAKLLKIAEDIGKAGLYSAILIMTILFIRFAVERISQNSFDTKKHIAEMFHFFLLAITVVVVAVPEGLPLAVTLSLAYSVKKMLDDKNLVRKLQACETMGGANNICSDKTGTLTQNLMTLTTWWNTEYQQFDFQADKLNMRDYFPPEFEELYIQNCALNSSAQLRPDERGSKTEIAIIKSLEKLGVNYETIRNQFNDETCRKIPFSSKRKRMSCIVKSPNGKQRIYVKGASEMVLKTCTRFHNKKTQQIVPLDDSLRNEVNVNIKRMADNALRTICLAYRDVTVDIDHEKPDQFGVYQVEQQDLILMGIFGIADVIRKEVPHAVEICQKAGITVRMVTGDNIDTARAIAKECGIVKPGDNSIIMEGTEFIEKTGGVVCKKCRVLVCDCPRDRDTAKKLKKPVRVDTIKNAEVFDQIYPNFVVMARSRPEDKYALVTGLIERDNVVAVTGDGTNDAPALKKADVGFAMGIAGTEVARQAADIILIDDNFKSIVAAVMWGRNIYDCIKKFLQFQLTVNIVAVLITLIGSAIIKQEVVTPIQLLWLNMIMDTLASLALATEPPTEKLLDRQPANRYEYIVSKKMCKHIILQSIYQLIIICIFTFTGETIIPETSDKKFLEKIVEEFDSRVMQRYKADNTIAISELIWSQQRWDESNTQARLDAKPWQVRLLEEGVDVSQIVTEPFFQQIYNGDSFDTAINYLESNLGLSEKDALKYIEKRFYRIRYHTDELKTIVSGREVSYNGMHSEYEVIFEIFDTPSRHFTFMFNLFVMMQMFNFVNARKVYDEFNTFDGISRNMFFIGIIAFVIVAQALIVTFGGFAFNCYNYYGLNGPQWGICIAFGILGNVLNLFIKGVDEEKFITFNLGWGDKAVKGSDDDEEDEDLGDDQAENNPPQNKENSKKADVKNITDDQINNLPKNKSKLPPIDSKQSPHHSQNVELPNSQKRNSNNVDVANKQEDKGPQE